MSKKLKDFVISFTTDEAVELAIQIEKIMARRVRRHFIENEGMTLDEANEKVSVKFFNVAYLEEHVAPLIESAEVRVTQE